MAITKRPSAIDYAGVGDVDFSTLSGHDSDHWAMRVRTAAKSEPENLSTFVSDLLDAPGDEIWGVTRLGLNPDAVKDTKPKKVAGFMSADAVSNKIKAYFTLINGKSTVTSLLSTTTTPGPAGTKEEVESFERLFLPVEILNKIPKSQRLLAGNAVADAIYAVRKLLIDQLLPGGTDMASSALLVKAGDSGLNAAEWGAEEVGHVARSKVK